MIICANCPRQALYTYKVNDSYLIHYCQSHLPRFLTAQKNAGLLTLQVPAPVVVEEPVVVKSSKKEKKEETTVEEPVVEEVPEEDAPTEE